MKFKAKRFDCHVNMEQQVYGTVKFWVRVLAQLIMVCLLGQKSLSLGALVFPVLIM